MIGNATYRGRAAGELVLGKSSQKQTPFIQFYFEVTQGENKGGKVRWSGYFTEKTSERTYEALYNCGWKGDDVSEFADGHLHGLDANEVDIVVELEKYLDDDGKERVTPRVQFVNRVGSGLMLSSRLSEAEAKALADKSRAIALAVRAKMGASPANGGAPASELPF